MGKAKSAGFTRACGRCGAPRTHYIERHTLFASNDCKCPQGSSGKPCQGCGVQGGHRANCGEVVS